MFYLALVDLYGQIVGIDSTSSLTAIVDTSYNTDEQFSPVLEGKQIFYAVNGVFRVENITFASRPGTTHQILFSTNGIDLSKRSNQEYIRENS